MSTELRKAKMLWHCRRGMLELDIIFQRFTKQHLETLSAQEVDHFEHLLTYPDPDLYAWLMGYESPPSQELQDIVAIIKNRDSTFPVE